MQPFLHNALKRFDPETSAFAENWTFSLQSGEEILKEFFTGVKRFDYEDSLAVTNTQDLIDWIKSSMYADCISKQALSGLFDYFESLKKQHGAICIPKEAGLFTAE